MINLPRLTDVAIEAAKKAGEIIRHYIDGDIEIVEKKGGESYASQVVTEVDLKCEKIILAQLLPLCDQYDIALLSEESDDDGGRFDKDYFWCIDPLDGTLPFSRSLTYVTDRALADTPHQVEIEQWLSQKASQLDLEGIKVLSGSGAVMNAILVLENGPACMLKYPKHQNGGGSIWDYAATACIYHELQLPATNFEGGRLDLTKGAIQ